jgi:hypothetical protein
VSLPLLAAFVAGVGDDAAISATRCTGTLVHYRAYKSMERGLAPIPWIAAAPTSSAIVGHLFYYDAANLWRGKRVPRLRMYSGGQSPDGRVSMKILWELRRGSALALRVQGSRLDGVGSFAQQVGAATSRQFPSIIDVPAPGCWRLNLKAGRATGRVDVLVVRGTR